LSAQNSKGNPSLDVIRRSLNTSSSIRPIGVQNFRLHPGSALNIADYINYYQQHGKLDAQQWVRPGISERGRVTLKFVPILSNFPHLPLLSKLFSGRDLNCLHDYGKLSCILKEACAYYTFTPLMRRPTLYCLHFATLPLYVF